jgi:DNA-binding MarR family transcriptional regulator
MNSLEFQERWLAATGDEHVAEMESLARDIGFALPSISIAALRDFLSQFGPGAEATENRVARTFRATAIDIVASYETACTALDAERSAESLVLHEGWRRIMNELAEGPSGPSELAAVLGVSKSHTSRALSAMRRADLVEVSASTSAKERPHRLTSLGNRLVEKLNEEANVLPSPLEAERSEIAELVLRPLASFRFKTSRELRFYVGLL